jgi:hypothetical protein
MGDGRAARRTTCGIRVSDEIPAAVGHRDTRGRWDMRRIL